MAIDAEQTGVTDGNAATHSPDVVPALHQQLEGRRPARRDRLLEHGGLHRVDDREDELLAIRHGALAQHAQPGVLLAGPAASAEE